jgi:hypothetical protein
MFTVVGTAAASFETKLCFGVGSRYISQLTTDVLHLPPQAKEGIEGGGWTKPTRVGEGITQRRAGLRLCNLVAPGHARCLRRSLSRKSKKGTDSAGDRAMGDYLFQTVPRANFPSLSAMENAVLMQGSGRMMWGIEQGTPLSWRPMI